MTDMSNSIKPIKTAMLIDDEPVDHMMYRRIVNRSGLVGDVISFKGADEALEYLRTPDCPEIDVIFLDINMPRMNGFEFLEAATEEMGANFTKMIVVMLTTSLLKADRERASQYKVVRKYITKPLTVDHISHVAGLLGGAAA